MLKYFHNDSMEILQLDQLKKIGLKVDLYIEVIFLGLIFRELPIPFENKSLSIFISVVVFWVC